MSNDINNGINSGTALRYLNYIEPYVREINEQKKEIASLKEQLDRQQEQHEKAMIRAGIEITKVQDKHDELLEQLKREQDCVDFYADKDNWVDMEMIGYSSSIRNDEQCGNEFGESEYLSIGGKLARSAQARREK